MKYLKYPPSVILLSIELKRVKSMSFRIHEFRKLYYTSR